jgi:Outer membrane protein beta-barrel domain
LESGAITWHFPKTQVMKKLILSMLALSLFWANAMAQAPKGSVLIGSSTSVWGGVSGIQDLLPANSGGISFTKTKYKYDKESIDADKSTTFNFSPRVGYAFMDGLVAGLKINYFLLKSEDEIYDEEFTSTGIGAGPFIRYFVPTKGNAKPFVEAETAFGRITEKYDGEEDEDKTSTMRLGGGLGVAFFFNDHVAFDVMGGYFYNSSKDPDSEEDIKEITSGFGLGLGLTVFLSPTSK